MSKSHHCPNWPLPPPKDYLNDLLGKNSSCPKSSCKGILVEVWTRYKDNGVINIEKECTTCGRVIKDLRFAKGKSFFTPREDRKNRRTTYTKNKKRQSRGKR